ncbi:DUF1304 domain-containing protein [Streptococcus sciuri]|uniref:DUF1304 domain-containing protein n=1 Tax=Streptococcus sciuri TaxID=2973939 RepID=A0ABT2F6Y4_9STRE|nr:DUF1304 domain-containing protein [Streptococcus sciuri]MCS4488189.1 DUF1304 domain-containing protein [Streptococcus sciuri]
MSFITIFFATLVAFEHLYIMYLETFATQSDATSRVFSTDKEELSRSSVDSLFKNQGVYNGLIGIFLLYSLWIAHSVELVTAFLLYVVIVAIYGALTVDKKILLKQAGLAILALLSLLL